MFEEAVKLIQRGDVLGYYKATTTLEALIQFGERLEDGPHNREYYHVAVALDNFSKIEADGVKVAINPITSDNGYAIFRLPVSQSKIDQALTKLRGLMGQRYDWVLIVDDGLRYLSKGITGRELLHLPAWFVRRKERTEKICVSVLRKYCNYLHYEPIGNLDTWSSPEDWCLALEDCEVKSQ